MFNNKINQLADKPRYMAASVSIGVVLGVVVAMLSGGDGFALPIGIGAGIAVGAAVGAILIRRGRVGG